MYDDFKLFPLPRLTYGEHSALQQLRWMKAGRYAVPLGPTAETPTPMRVVPFPHALMLLSDMPRIVRLLQNAKPCAWVAGMLTKPLLGNTTGADVMEYGALTPC